MTRLARAVGVVLAVAVATAPSALAQQCCTGNVTTYCTAGTSVQGCTPQVSGVGVPSADAAGGFTVALAELPGRRFATLLYSFGPFSQPWWSGNSSVLCVAPPLQRDRVRWSGGRAGACDGAASWDFNYWRSANPFSLGAPFLVGSTVHAQGWYRDPSVLSETNLTNALRFELCAGLGACSTPPAFVAIQPGTFQMGSNAANGAPYFNEYGWSPQPVHAVTISYAFWMGAREVTQAEYQSLMGTNPAHFVGHAHFPVEQVSWSDARAYCAALTSQMAASGTVPAGYEVRLPTEAEWEYACRAGTTTEFNTGAGLICSHARFHYSYHSDSNCSHTPNGTGPVGNYAPNAWGLYDMHGNVSEWCLDSAASYAAGEVTDPFVTGGPHRVFRGGSWSSSSLYCRSAIRSYNVPSLSYNGLGFRVVLAPARVP